MPRSRPTVRLEHHHNNLKSVWHASGRAGTRIITGIIARITQADPQDGPGRIVTVTVTVTRAGVTPGDGHLNVTKA